MSEDPNVSLLEERQLRVSRTLRSGGPAMPTALRSRLAERSAPRRPVGSRSRARLALAGGLAAAALALGLVLTILSDRGGSLTVEEAARPSSFAATGAAPTTDDRRPALLRATFAGVSYPAWERQFEWFATGQRRDSLVGGRRARTVFYRHAHHRIGYTVVGGPALDPPERGERYVVNGLEMVAYKDGPRDVLTFVRNGRTCVLAGEVHRRSTLVKLASWEGDGTIAL
jgi:hypothetical protein